MNKKILTTSGFLMAIALLLAVNIISNTTLTSARLDLTDNKLYTLSQGTKNILASLEEPITLRFYLSKKLASGLPAISHYTLRVRELLEEYQRLAGNNINLHIIDPEPFSEAEDSAEGYGIQGVPVDNSNTKFYFGLAATNSTDDEKVIAFFSPNREEFLEYDLTQLIYQLNNTKKTVVGLMSSLPIQADRDSSWMIVDHLSQLFEIRKLKTEIDEDVDVLMLVHPKDLSDDTLYAIDQFVLKGGKAIVFADPYSEAYKPPTDPKNPLAAMQASRNSDLNKLFDAWGIEIVAEKVIGDLRAAKKVQMQKGNSAIVVTYPVWMDLNAKHNFNQSDIITAKLDNMILATPGAIVKKGDVATKIIPLIETSNIAMKIDVKKLGMFSQPEDLARDFKQEGKFTLAARVIGKAKTAFPDNKDSVKEAEINVIVVADTDLLEDKFWVRVQNLFGQRLAMPHAANATFVSNALDNLSGSTDLISVRNRGSSTRPFIKVAQIQQYAEIRFREKEKQLQARLEQAEQKLNSLQSDKQGGNELMLNIQQQQEIERFRQQKIKIRKELRNVQHALQKDIERLETQMMFFNIGLMPILIGFLGLWFGMSSRRRRKN
ncbi:Gldg family protein [Candidatus Marithrix sp. Canyon 246]|uniref:Gldg family protein n=1 Tax=Candidatus Marithrix sp. Canyon 246 TaxID=1827136 RepID=UPI00084A0AC7|nr:Gldg family protein [Candidatus Marithrix sp. Canyon 246]